MVTTVDIVVKGIAICYKKENNWHVLFPVDKCHSVNFSHKKIDDLKDSDPTPLSKAANPILVTTKNAASVSSQTQNFEKHVLDLTSSGMHPKIKKKGDLKGKAVLLTIPNARFSVRKYLQEFPNVEVPDLEEVDTTNRRPLKDELIAHSVKATIILNEDGHLTVESDALGTNFITDKGESFILTFDNDCVETKLGHNDMDMFYEVIQDTEKPDRMFRIGGIGETKGLLVEPPDFRQGKPCLVVTASDPNDLP